MLVFSSTKFKNQLMLNGYTSKDVARLSGLTEMTISRAVTGANKPLATTVARIAKVLNCKPKDLLEDSNTGE